MIFDDLRDSMIILGTGFVAGYLIARYEDRIIVIINRLLALINRLFW